MITSKQQKLKGMPVKYSNKTADLLSFIPAELDCPYQRTDNAYPRYLDTIVNNVKNEVACEVTCTFYEQFVCRSFAFYASASQCFLSGDDKGKLYATILSC